MKKKNVTILGSTGSIGRNALQVIEHFKDRFNVLGLSGHNNIKLLSEQIKKFNPEFVCVTNNKNYKLLKSKFKTLKIYNPEEGLLKLTSLKQNDIILISLVGAVGLEPTINALKNCKRVAVANKEPLVMAGKLVMNTAKKYNSELLPVDSEHNAIYQCLKNENKKSVQNILLTGSGGPFRNYKKSFRNITVEQALKHPNWAMGKKITIDSATLMNKGLEVIEAKWLFDIDINKIKVIIHPQSIIHSMVEFNDGSIIAQMGKTDMKFPIQYALTYPDRLKNPFKKLKFIDLDELTFFKPDIKKFECLDLAYKSISEGGIKPTVLNAANEIAVKEFLSGNIRFTDIPIIIKKTLKSIENINRLNLNTIIKKDNEARNIAIDISKKIKK